MRNFLSIVLIMITIVFCVGLILYNPKFKKEMPPTSIKDTVCLDATINYKIDSIYKLNEDEFITITLNKIKKDILSNYNVEVISDKFNIERLYYKTDSINYVYLYKMTPLMRGKYQITVKITKNKCKTLITQDVSIK